MAVRELVRAVELKAGEHSVVELGELPAGAQIMGSLKDSMHDDFLYTILDEKNYKKFMETEDEADADSEDLMVIAEGDGKGHYQVDAEVVEPGKYFLVVESEAAALKRKIKVNLRISS
jgi:hypothetical protein